MWWKKNTDTFKIISGQRSFFGEKYWCREMHCKRGDIKLGPEERRNSLRKTFQKEEYGYLKALRPFL